MFHTFLANKLAYLNETIWNQHGLLIGMKIPHLGYHPLVEKQYMWHEKWLWNQKHFRTIQNLVFLVFSVKLNSIFFINWWKFKNKKNTLFCRKVRKWPSVEMTFSIWSCEEMRCNSGSHSLKFDVCKSKKTKTPTFSESSYSPCNSVGKGNSWRFFSPEMNEKHE